MTNARLRDEGLDELAEIARVARPRADDLPVVPLGHVLEGLREQGARTVGMGNTGYLRSAWEGRGGQGIQPELMPWCCKRSRWAARGGGSRCP